MPIIEGYSQLRAPFLGHQNFLISAVKPGDNIILTPQRHTYTFHGFKQDIINRLLAKNGSLQFGKVCRAGTADIDWTGLGSVMAAITFHDRPAPTAADSGFDKGIFLGVFKSMEAHEGSFIPKVPQPTIGAPLAQHTLVHALPAMMQAAATAIHQTHSVAHLASSLSSTPHTVSDDGRNTRLLRRPRTTAEVQNKGWWQELKEKAGIEEKIFVRISILPGPDMLKSPDNPPVSLQQFANFLNAMDPI